MNDRPLAMCGKCRTTLELKIHTSFSYWWCAKCKDEPFTVNLATIRCPAGERYGVKRDSDIVLDKPGVYKLIYLTGATEWYERDAHASPTILDGTRVRSATRVDDGYLPSRKPVQLEAAAGTGEEPQGTRGDSLRAVPNAANSLPGRIPLAPSIENALNQDVANGVIKAWRFDPDTDVFELEWPHCSPSQHTIEDLEDYTLTHPSYVPSKASRGGTSSGVFSSTAPAMQQLEDGSIRLQQWGLYVITAWDEKGNQTYSEHIKIDLPEDEL